MAKFCIHCGTPLEDGALCNCPGASAQRAASAVPPVTPALEQDTAPAQPEQTQQIQPVPSSVQAPQPAAQDSPYAQPIPQARPNMPPAQPSYIQPVPQQPYAQPTQYGQQQPYQGKFYGQPAPYDQQQYAQQPYPGQPAKVSSVDTTAIGAFLKNLFLPFLTFFKAPGVTASEIADNSNIGRSLSIIGLQAIFAGAIFANIVVQINKVFGANISSLLGILGGLNGSSKSFGKSISSALPNPVAYFFYGFLAVAGYAVLLALALFVFSTAFKVNHSFEKTLAFAASGSIPMVWAALFCWLFLLVGIGASTFSLALLCAVLFCAIAMSCVSVHHAFSGGIENKDKALLAELVSFACVIFVFTLIVMLTVKG